MVKNLWGNLPDAAALKVPLVILKEQAGILEQLTGGLILGGVETQNIADGRLLANLVLIVPMLNNYRYVIVETLAAAATVYPAMLRTRGDNWIEAGNPDDFEAKLEQLLSSEVSRKVVAGLLAQAKGASSI